MKNERGESSDKYTLKVKYRKLVRMAKEFTEKYSRVDIKYHMRRSPVVVQEITYNRHVYKIVTANRIKAEGFNNYLLCVWKQSVQCMSSYRNA